MLNDLKRQLCTGEKDWKSYDDLLLSTLKSSNLSVKSIIITHWHHDHLGGCGTVRKLLEEWESSRKNSSCSSAAREEDCRIPVYKFPHEEDRKMAPGEEIYPLHDQQVIYFGIFSMPENFTILPSLFHP